MIYNNPFEMGRITYSYVWWDNAFTEDELKKIENVCEKEEFEKATTVGQKTQDETEKVRRSKIKFFDRIEHTSWIFDRFNNICESLNEQFYRFDLYGYNKFQYTIYNSENNGMYDWHMDTILNEVTDDVSNNYTRKLTMVMLLSEPEKDFTGGEFQLNLGKEENPTIPYFNKGKIIAFPSFMIHRVKPVLTGIRKSIVIWVEGPKFR